MSDKTNDEKLRILQERLAQIRHKQDSPEQAKEQMTTNSFNLSKKEESDKEYQKSGFSLEKKGTSSSIIKENSHSLNPDIEDIKRKENPLASELNKLKTSAESRTTRISGKIDIVKKMATVLQDLGKRRNY